MIKIKSFYKVTAASPVFARMLEADMKEASVGRIEIADVESETIECLLCFIYNGALSTDLLSGDILIELLRCADKYDMIELKAETLKRMDVSLSTENVIKLVSAAKTHGADEETLNQMLLFFSQLILTKTDAIFSLSDKSDNYCRLIDV